MPLSISYLEGEAGGFGLMLELMTLYPSSDVRSPLAAYIGRREGMESVDP